METYYANLFAYRVTGNELALEFGTFFPGEDNRQAPGYDDFALRVVTQPDYIPHLIKLLQDAQVAFEAAKAPAKKTKSKPRGAAK